MFSPLKTLNMLYLRRRPFLLNQKVNIACDCKCKTCDSWRIGEKPELLLTRAEIESLLDRAAAAGMLSYSVWGGEPLLRGDLPALLSYAVGKGLFTTVSTNGSRLSERAVELIPHASLFVVSLDGIGATHDRVRGFPGLYDKVVQGIGELRSHGGKARLFFNVNRLNTDDITEAARLARELAVSIYFFPILPFPGHNDGILLDEDARRAAFETVLRLKQEGYPIINIASYLRLIRDGRPTDCRFPSYHVFVDYEGSIYTCDLNTAHKQAVWGNARDTDLAALFDSEAFHSKARELRTCNACRTACGELGYRSPLVQFSLRAFDKIRHEWLLQKNPR